MERVVESPATAGEGRGQFRRFVERVRWMARRRARRALGGLGGWRCRKERGEEKRAAAEEAIEEEVVEEAVVAEGKEREKGESQNEFVSLLTTGSETPVSPKLVRRSAIRGLSSIYKRHSAISSCI